MKILFGDLHTQVGKENILKPTIIMGVNTRIVMIMVLEL